jgi:transposase
VPGKHPLRLIREIANAALMALDAEFAALYSGLGRSSIAPEKLRRASLQAFYSVRSERQLMEQIDGAVGQGGETQNIMDWKPVS